jgi:hypothetical protein
MKRIKNVTVHSHKRRTKKGITRVKTYKKRLVVDQVPVMMYQVRDEHGRIMGWSTTPYVAKKRKKI